LLLGPVDNIKVLEVGAIHFDVLLGVRTLHRAGASWKGGVVDHYDLGVGPGASDIQVGGFFVESCFMVKSPGFKGVCQELTGLAPLFISHCLLVAQEIGVAGFVSENQNVKIVVRLHIRKLDAELRLFI
jgi:hypothetical protein